MDYEVERRKKESLNKSPPSLPEAELKGQFSLKGVMSKYMAEDGRDLVENFAFLSSGCGASEGLNFSFENCM